MQIWFISLVFYIAIFSAAEKRTIKFRVRVELWKRIWKINFGVPNLPKSWKKVQRATSFLLEISLNSGFLILAVEKNYVELKLGEGFTKNGKKPLEKTQI